MAGSRAKFANLKCDAPSLVTQPLDYEDITAALERIFRGREFLSIKDVSSLFGMDYKTVYYALKKGNISGHQIGAQWFIKRSDLALLVKKSSNAPKSPLEKLVDGLDDSDPNDWRLRQELDSYISGRVGQVRRDYSLKPPYDLGYVTAELSALVKGMPVKGFQGEKPAIVAMLQERMGTQYAK